MAVVDNNAAAKPRPNDGADDASATPRGCTTFLGLNLTIDAHFFLNQKNQLKLQVLDPQAPGWKLLDVAPRLFRRTMGVQRAQRIFARLREDQRDVHFIRKVIDAFDLQVEYTPAALQRIPKQGPLVVVANHPLNGVDGMCIAHLITQVRQDVKIMLTATFDGFPGMAEYGIFVHDSSGPSSRNRSEPARKAIDWLRQGHVVILFPAAQGSYVKVPGRKDPVDVPWLKGTTLFIRGGKASVLPVYVHGGPGKLFLAVRHIFHPAACALLVREIVNKEGSTVRLEVGEAISHECVVQQGRPEEQMKFLREQTYALGGEAAGT
jgi:putative hemolysin